jgi:hypothetical protein
MPTKEYQNSKKKDGGEKHKPKTTVHLGFFKIISKRRKKKGVKIGVDDVSKVRSVAY